MASILLLLMHLDLSSQTVLEITPMKGLEHKTISAILVSGTTCWIGTEKGLFYGQLSIEQKQILKLNSVRDLDQAIAHLCYNEDKSGVFAISYSDTLWSVTNEGFEALINLSPHFRGNPLVDLNLRSGTEIIVSGQNGVLLFKPDVKTWIPAPEGTRLSCAASDKLGRFFIGTDKGLYQLTPFKTWKKLEGGYVYEISVNEDDILALYKDTNEQLDLYSIKGLSDPSVSSVTFSDPSITGYELNYRSDRLNFTWITGDGVTINKKWESGYVTNKAITLNKEAKILLKTPVAEVIGLDENTSLLLSESGNLNLMKTSLIPKDARVYLGTIVADKILFKSNKSRLNRRNLTARTVISELVRLLKDHPSYVVQINGYTGKTYKNEKKLSEKRAEALKTELFMLGISKDRIYTYGSGRWSREIDPSSESGANKTNVVLINY